MSTPGMADRLVLSSSSEEASYGTAQLKSLGLEAASVALVWTAAPLAGLLVPPLVSRIADNDPSRFRRRAGIVLSTLLTAASLLYLVYADDIGYLFSRSDKESGGWVGKIIGVLSAWALQVGLNALGATSRDLILDVTPAAQQPTADAYYARLSDLASLAGFLLGALDVPSWRWLAWTSGGQMRKLAMIAVVVLFVLVSVTCVAVSEKSGTGATDETVAGKRQRMGLAHRWSALWHTWRCVPVQVRRICYVQALTWSALYPFSFEASTYVSDVLALSATTSSQAAGSELSSPLSDLTSRTSAFALLLYAAVSCVSSVLLPWILRLASPHNRITRHSPRFLQRTLAYTFALTNVWTIGFLVHAGAMLATCWDLNVVGATTVIAVMGFSWAVELWVPYILAVECLALPPSASLSSHSQSLHALARHPARHYTSAHPFSTVASAALLHRSELRPRLDSATYARPSAHDSPVPRNLNRAAQTAASVADDTDTLATAASPDPSALLTLLNLSIVLPQIAVSLLTFVAFRIATWVAQDDLEPGLVVWLFRVAGGFAVCAAVASRGVVEPARD
ncbi:uncharacterized protein JCM10292_005441 [Rhodotorula paludigena]|uniref:uncharacterized protein n=1 Tax=Rhodotorula paludigena TaxID=86838 RepID=UPI00317172BA